MSRVLARQSKEKQYKKIVATEEKADQKVGQKTKVTQ